MAEYYSEALACDRCQSRQGFVHLVGDECSGTLRRLRVAPDLEERTKDMRPRGVVALALCGLNERRLVLLRYRETCAVIHDHHGVQDASSDLRELDAAEAALRWVLGERETLGY